MVQCLQQNDIQNIIVFCDSDGKPPGLLYTHPAVLSVRPFQMLLTASVVPAALCPYSPSQARHNGVCSTTEAGLLLQLCPFTDPWALTSQKVGGVSWAMLNVLRLAAHDVAHECATLPAC